MRFRRKYYEYQIGIYDVRKNGDTHFTQYAKIILFLWLNGYKRGVYK